MLTSPTILVVDDDPIARRNLARLLERDSRTVLTAAGGRGALAVVERGGIDLVLTDLVMEDIDGLTLLGRVKALDPTVEVIVVTGHASVDTAIEAMRRHAFHYLQKPLHPAEVRLLVTRALEQRQLRADVTRLRALVNDDDLGIVGTSPPIVALRRLLRQVAQSEANVLITGESGTGKELAASAIHRLSRRSSHRFVAMNCASFAEELLANELFGHERGAFTGAHTTRPGLLECADGGTVFFDEVGDMPTAMQAKLLRVLQQKELIRVGGSKAVQIDVRIIAATNQDLKRAIRNGTFRQDLYYRLDVVPVSMPRLADRREDIPLLARHFLARHNAISSRPIEGISREALTILARYKFPGNVRELENIVARAAALARHEVIDVDDLPDDLKEIETYTFHRDRQPYQTLADLEHEYIQWVLQRCDNNRSRAAAVLGINRVSLYRKLKRQQIRDE